MTRELKFRVWNTVLKKYVCPNVVQQKDGLWLNLGNEDNIYEFEQYTGLKDKNGKEIYEGDIVKINKGKWGKDGEWVARKELHKGVFIVVYDELNANFVSISKEDEDEEELLSFADKLYEIIGNIHENPELLGGEE